MRTRNAFIRIIWSTGMLCAFTPASASSPRAGELLLEATTSQEFRTALEAKAAGHRTHSIMLPVEPVASLPARVDRITLSLDLADWQLRNQSVLADDGTSTYLILVFERRAI